MLFVAQMILLLFSTASATTCQYKGVEHEQGEKWTFRSSFVMECIVHQNGSWIAKVIGCKTPNGRFLQPGEEETENDTKFGCVQTASGTIQIQRKYKPVEGTYCEGHKVGESWVSKINFNKTCFATGTRITNCLSDTGIPIALNSKYTFSGIVYSCNSYPNGTVIISRESVPVKKLPSTQLTCKVNGVTREVGESWIEDNQFVRKCDERGTVFTEACILEDKSKLFVNSKMSRNGKVYYCNQNPDGTVFFSVKDN